MRRLSFLSFSRHRTDEIVDSQERFTSSRTTRSSSRPSRARPASTRGGRGGGCSSVRSTRSSGGSRNRFSTRRVRFSLFCSDFLPRLTFLAFYSAQRPLSGGLRGLLRPPRDGRPLISPFIVPSPLSSLSSLHFPSTHILRLQSFHCVPLISPVYSACISPPSRFRSPFVVVHSSPPSLPTVDFLPLPSRPLSFIVLPPMYSAIAVLLPRRFRGQVRRRRVARSYFFREVGERRQASFASRTASPLSALALCAP